MGPAPFDPFTLRGQFPALRREVAGRAAIYADGPGGTQVPQTVIDAVSGPLTEGSANLGGPFATSIETDELVDRARRAMASLFNADPGEIVFGQNMTSLTFAMSRAIARTWQPGDEIVVTHLDHDANVAPWLLAARDREVSVRWLDFDPEDCSFDLADLQRVLTPRTKLVAVTAASNAVGTLVDVSRVATAARSVGALVFVDAVHFTPHQLVDVRSIGCDFLVASAYKFFGPHTGILFGKSEHLDSLEAYKVRPAPSDPPDKWETGTQSFESLAGVVAAVDYLASIASPGETGQQRPALEAAFSSIAEHERVLSQRFLDGIASIEGVRLYGAKTPAGRTPTFAISVRSMSAAQVVAALADVGIFAWAGHYYAVEVMDRLGVLDSGGLVRIGFVHYNTTHEVEQVVAALRALAGGKSIDEAPEFHLRTSGIPALSPYVTYDMTDLPDPRTVSRQALADGIAEIVAVEGPVTTDRAYQVFVKSSGGKKVTKPVRDDLDWAVELLVERRRVAIEEHTVANGDQQRILRRIDMPSVIVRELGDRDLYKVPLSEVAEVVAGARYDSPDRGEEELKRAVLEIYGLKRLTPTASAYLDSAMRLAGI